MTSTERCCIYEEAKMESSGDGVTPPNFLIINSKYQLIECDKNWKITDNCVKEKSRKMNHCFSPHIRSSSSLCHIVMTSLQSEWFGQILNKDLTYLHLAMNHEGPTARLPTTIALFVTTGWKIHQPHTARLYLNDDHKNRSNEILVSCALRTTAHNY